MNRMPLGGSLVNSSYYKPPPHLLVLFCACVCLRVSVVCLRMLWPLCMLAHALHVRVDARDSAHRRLVCETHVREKRLAL